MAKTLQEILMEGNHPNNSAKESFNEIKQGHQQEKDKGRDSDGTWYYHVHHSDDHEVYAAEGRGYMIYSGKHHGTNYSSTEYHEDAGNPTAKKMEKFAKQQNPHLDDQQTKQIAAIITPHIRTRF